MYENNPKEIAHPPVSKTPVIHSQIDRMRESTEQLDIAIAVLIERLYPVLGIHEPTKPEDPQETPGLEFSYVAEALYLNTDKLDSLIDTVRSVTNRLEI